MGKYCNKMFVCKEFISISHNLEKEAISKEHESQRMEQ